ncbi:MAG: hypothetical protein CBB97_13890 [Candidatus Endolissoclinum sp. TMED37]|nr:MAG: hypothetical protein CBB97_13890 [Candidatus Endolissoclinum sp. TMED37]
MNKLTKNPCDVCSSENVANLPHVEVYTGGQKLHVCRNCGFVFASLRREKNEIAKDWSDKLFSKKFDAPEKVLSKKKRHTYSASIPAVIARLTYVKEFISSNIELKNKTLCDVGAGQGQFLNLIKNKIKKKNLFGIEPSKENISLIKELKFNCLHGLVEDYNEKKKFDIVTVNWTIENSGSAKSFLNSCNKLLNNNGYICIATGSRILVPFKKPMNYYFNKSAMDIHPFHFSFNSIKNLLTTTGFKTVHFNRFIDTDYLCVIARKQNKLKINIEKEDYKDVINFFKRWHKETQYYL